MIDISNKKVQLAAAFFSIFVFGTLGYYYLEDGWTLIDSFYMVVITITTVGFGEINELSPSGRLFTAFLIFAGVGTGASFITHFARFIIEGEMKGLFGRKKMFEKIKKIKDHYIVCGHGKNGSSVCLKLYENGLPFVVIESHEEALALANQRGYLTVDGNAASDASLLAAGIERAAGIVTCITDDAATIFVALAARELNSKVHIIAQSHDHGIETRMIRAGVNKVVYPLKLGGEQIARMIAQELGEEKFVDRRSRDSEVLGYSLKFFKHFEETPITVAQAVEKTGAVKAVSLKLSETMMLDDPDDDLEVKKDDSLVLLFRKNDPARKEKIPVIPDYEWREEYEIGNNVIDEQHQSLFKLVSDFHKSMQDGPSKGETINLFEKLLEYTVTHFRHEETLMKKYNYPKIEEQIRQHREFTTEIMDLNKDHNFMIQENINEFLNSWLANHIMTSDQEFGKFLTEKGII